MLIRFFGRLPGYVTQSILKRIKKRQLSEVLLPIIFIERKQIAWGTLFWFEYTPWATTCWFLEFMQWMGEIFKFPFSLVLPRPTKLKPEGYWKEMFDLYSNKLLAVLEEPLLLYHFFNKWKLAKKRILQYLDSLNENFIKNNLGRFKFNRLSTNCINPSTLVTAFSFLCSSSHKTF